MIYGAQAPHPIIEIDTITHRDNPIMQVAFLEEHVVDLFESGII